MQFLMRLNPLLLLILLSLIPLQTAQANEYVVGCNTDEAIRTYDLITAFSNANSNPGDDVITLADCDYHLVTANNNTGGSGNNGLPVIANNGTLTINGNDAWISAPYDSNFRLLYVSSGATLIMRRLNLSDGNGTAYGGGNILNDGGTVVINNSRVLWGSASFGGSIWNKGGTLQLLKSSVEYGSASVTNGGGILNDQGTVYLANSEIENSWANNTGGGLQNNGGTVTMSNTTLFANRAVSGGGFNNNGGTVTISNSTLSGNEASRPGAISPVNVGGGFMNSSGAVTITNATLSENTATGAAGGFYNAGTLMLKNNIIANSTGGECTNSTGTISGGYNLLETACTNGSGSISLSHTLTGDPMLEALALNGGLSRTHKLLYGSIAINAGLNSYIGTLSTDQRGTGYPRIINGTVDLGAYENICTGSDGFAIADSDEAGLMRAILCANDDPADNTITLAANSIYTFTEAAALSMYGDASALPIISSTGALTIEGNGATLERSQISGTPIFHLIHIGGGAQVTIDHLTVRGGKGTSFEAGGGITSDGTLNLNNSTVTGNTAEYGGGINGSVNLNNSIISGNSATYGGGIYGGGMLNNSIISGNSATYGGGIYGGGTVNHSTVSNNTASQGGGLYNRGSGVTIHNSTFSGNQAGIGGGFYNGRGSTIDAGRITVTNSTFTGNKPTAFMNEDAHVTVINSTIVGNEYGFVSSDPQYDMWVMSSVSLYNSIVANNTNGTCSLYNSGLYGSYNLLENGCGGSLTNTLSGDPGLGPLTGSPAYFPLMNLSPLIDAGRNAITEEHDLTTDQLGNPRFFDDQTMSDTGSGTAPIVDLGAVEHQSNSILPTIIPIAPQYPQLVPVAPEMPSSQPVNPAQPTEAVPLLPAGAATGNPVMFMWRAATGATSYSLQITTESGEPVYTGTFSATVDCTGEICQALPDVILTSGVNYLWSIQAEGQPRSLAMLFTYTPATFSPIVNE